MPDNFDYDRTKHLEMIQAAVARMAANSFTVKGWSVAASSALLAFATQAKRPALTLVALLPSLVFWGLDAYFLSLERRFRSLYDRVRAAAPADLSGGKVLTPYTLDPALGDGADPWTTAWTANGVRVLHGAVIIAVVGVGLLQWLTGQTTDATRVQIEGPLPVQLLHDSAARVGPAGASRRW